MKKLRNEIKKRTTGLTYKGYKGGYIIHTDSNDDVNDLQKLRKEIYNIILNDPDQKITISFFEYDSDLNEWYNTGAIIIFESGEAKKYLSGNDQESNNTANDQKAGKYIDLNIKINTIESNIIENVIHGMNEYFTIELNQINQDIYKIINNKYHLINNIDVFDDLLYRLENNILKYLQDEYDSCYRDKYKEKRKQIKSEICAIYRISKKINQVIDDNSDLLTEQYQADQKTDIKKLDDQADEIYQKIYKLSDLIDDVNNEKKSMLKYNRSYNILINQYQSIDQAINELNKLQDQYKKITDQLDELSADQDQLNEVNQAINEISCTNTADDDQAGNNQNNESRDIMKDQAGLKRIQERKSEKSKLYNHALRYAKRLQVIDWLFYPLGKKDFDHHPASDNYLMALGSAERLINNKYESFTSKDIDQAFNMIFDTLYDVLVEYLKVDNKDFITDDNFEFMIAINKLDQDRQNNIMYKYWIDGNNTVTPERIKERFTNKSNYIQYLENEINKIKNHFQDQYNFTNPFTNDEVLYHGMKLKNINDEFAFYTMILQYQNLIKIQCESVDDLVNRNMTFDNNQAENEIISSRSEISAESESIECNKDCLCNVSNICKYIDFQPFSEADYKLISCDHPTKKERK